jgi:hypothetical protein
MASLLIAPYCDPPKQASSAENASLIPFAGLRGSRTQSASRCRALAARVDDAVLTACFSRTRTQHCLGVCNPTCRQNWVSGTAADCWRTMSRRHHWIRDSCSDGNLLSRMI